MGKKNLSRKLQDSVDARKRHHLSHAHVQMARELGMNPKKLGKREADPNGEKLIQMGSEKRRRVPNSVE